MKSRSNARSNALVDSVRGRANIIWSDLTDQSVNSGTSNDLVSFDSNGFTVGVVQNAGSTNTNGDSIVAWTWKAGGTAVSNTNGTITSTVSANQAAGFSIVKWTSTGSNTSSETVGHGLINTPDVIILKNLSAAGTSWRVYHSGIPSPNNTLALNTTELAFPFFPSVSSNTFGLANSTTTGEASGTGGQNIIAYCFHSVDGYQKAGSYIGTGAAGNTVVTGFEPAFLMVKQTNISGSEWNIIDNKRDTQNPRDVTLWANSSASEATASQGGIYDVNFLSNGFSLENTYQSFNASGGTYIYLAIAADAQPAPVLANSFEPVIYTGNGGPGITTNSQNITIGFQPDLVWIKGRDNGFGGTSGNNVLFDSVRTLSAPQYLSSNLTNPSFGNTGSGVTSFNANGFTVADDGNGGGNVNGSSGGQYSNGLYVAWCWKAAGISTINTNGSITSITNANPAAGFSIVKFNGGNSSGTTVGHGLSSAPELIIVKNTSDFASWPVLTQTGYTIGATTFTLSGSSNYLALNSTTGYASYVFDQQLGGTANGGLSSDELIAYCFHSVSGYQKIGSYTGTGSSGNIVVTGFAPRFVMIKDSTNAGNWIIHSKPPTTSNPSATHLRANSSAAEDSGTGERISFDTNGFTIEGTGGNVNANNDTYIYLAIK
jgi:hypothetical protein